MSETDLSRSIAKAVEQLGCIVVRVQSGKVPTRGGFMQLAERGTPDRLVLGAHGQSLWLEIKQPGKQLAPDQVAWEKKAARLGHVVVRVDSVSSAIAAVRRELHV